MIVIFLFYFEENYFYLFKSDFISRVGSIHHTIICLLTTSTLPTFLGRQLTKCAKLLNAASMKYRANTFLCQWTDNQFIISTICSAEVVEYAMLVLTLILGGNSWSKDREFEHRRWIPEGLFFTWICFNYWTAFKWYKLNDKY